MIAETRGKLSPDSRQEFERLEDLLTDYVFGAIRHLPRSGVLLPLLQAWFPGRTWPLRDVEQAVFEFWPSFEGTEPDVLIRVGVATVVIEAKLWSDFGVGLHQDDDQLIREYRTVSDWAARRRLEAPLILAVTASFDQPPEVEEARSYVGDSNGVVFRWTNWQTIATQLETVRSTLALHEQLLVDDVLAVMTRRGVKDMFEEFVKEDYWLMAAAQRRSSESVFPTIAAFCQDLLSRLKDEAVVHGGSENKIMSHGSTSLSSPSRWGINYLYLPLWPRKWPTRNAWTDANLIVQFSLREPEVWVGYRQRIQTQQRDVWRGQLKGTVDAVRRLGARTVAESKYPDFGTPIRAAPAEAVDTNLLEAMLGDTEIYLSISRSIPLDSIAGTAMVAKMVLEDIQAIESVPLLLGSGLPPRGQSSNSPIEPDAPSDG